MTKQWGIALLGYIRRVPGKGATSPGKVIEEGHLSWAFGE